MHREIHEQNAIATYTQITNQFVKKITQKIKQTFPERTIEEEVDARGYEANIFMKINENGIRGWLRKLLGLQKKKKLVEIYRGGNIVKVTLYDPTIMPVCRNILNELEKRHTGKGIQGVEREYDFNPDETPESL